MRSTVERFLQNAITESLLLGEDAVGRLAVAPARRPVECHSRRVVMKPISQSDRLLDDLVPGSPRLRRNARFGDCRHGTKPECAVLAALTASKVELGRVTSYLKSRAERTITSTP